MGRLFGTAVSGVLVASTAMKIRNALLLLALAAAPGAAWAGPPDPGHSQIEPIIVGNSNGSQIGDGYRVIVRDFNGTPLGGISVELRFPGTGANPYQQQNFPASSQCMGGRYISKDTDANGLVVFQPRFGGFENGAGVTVKGNIINLGSVRARSTDINSDGATAVGDFNLFRLNFLFNPAAPETDYNEDGTTAVGDLDIFRKVFLFDSPGTPCP